MNATARHEVHPRGGTAPCPSVTSSNCSSFASPASLTSSSQQQELKKKKSWSSSSPPLVVRTGGITPTSGGFDLQHGDDDDCAAVCMICLDVIHEKPQDHDLLPCRHCFHRCCLNEWRMQRNSCPTCRCELDFYELHC
jgi:hypothetical protein